MLTKQHLVLAMFLIATGAGLGAGVAYGRGGISTDEHESAMRELQDSIQAAEARRRAALEERDAALAERDSALRVAETATAAARESAESADSWRARWAEIRGVVEADDSTILATFPELIGVVDSMEASCDDAVSDCHEALAAKDSVIERQSEAREATERAHVATEQALLFQTERANAEEAERTRILEEYERSIRWRGVRDALFFAGGAGTVLGALLLAGAIGG